MSPSPSGWYPNPHNPTEELYWDGAQWLGASRLRVIETPQVAGAAEYADSATVMRPVGCSWPPPSTFDPVAYDVPTPFDSDAQHTIAYGRALGGAVGPGSYDPNWDTMPLTTEGYGSPTYPSPPYACAPMRSAPYPPWYGTPSPYATRQGARTNGFALAALIVGACGLVLTAVPFLIGLVVGGIPDLLAIAFGVVGIVHSRVLGGAGLTPAILGVALGTIGLCAIPLGAGWLW
jgi:Protein of unknown function (DUF2510).